MQETTKNHWEKVYETKQPNEVSWTQEVPETSLEFIHSFNLPKTAKIIDVGGGDSKLVDFLLDEGYENITVLDISAKALERAKSRLGDKASQVTWIVSDVTEFQADTTYDIWHDRATFHFLTTTEQINQYLDIANRAIGSYLTIGTFSKNGPTINVVAWKSNNIQNLNYKNNLLKGLIKSVVSRRITPPHSTPSKTSYFVVLEK